MDANVNAPVKACNPVRMTVWYTGTDALFEGEAVCLNTDYGTATDVDGRRINYVERPSADNNFAFCGVADRNYSAKSGGQVIAINAPGSLGVKVALGANVAIGVGRLNFQVGGGSGAGRFVKAGFPGRGSIVPRQTVAAGILEDGLTGTWSLAVDGITLTMTATAGLAAGDTVILVSGEQESATKKIVPGRYTIASITDATDLVLSSSAVGATPVAALTCAGYAFNGNPTCQADLDTGAESGGTEFASILNAGNAAQPHMVGGVTFISATDISGDADIVLADGVMLGDKKGVVIIGTIATNDVTIVPATAGIVLAGTALTEITGMDVIADAAYLVWNGVWRTDMVVGGAIEG
jgi:hypothetical protein